MKIEMWQRINVPISEGMTKVIHRWFANGATEIQVQDIQETSNLSPEVEAEANELRAKYGNTLFFRRMRE